MASARGTLRARLPMITASSDSWSNRRVEPRGNSIAPPAPTSEAVDFMKNPCCSAVRPLLTERAPISPMCFL